MQSKPAEARSVIDRTLGNLVWGWKKLAMITDDRTLVLRPDLPEADIRPLYRQMQKCVDARGGEASARTHAAVLGQAYLDLNDQGRHRFMKLIVDRFGIDETALRQSMTAYLAQGDERDPHLLNRTRELLTPPWTTLFTQFNALPSGVKFLVDMRSDLIRFSREDEELEALDRDLQRLLVSWFDIGFLDLRRITWDEPASLLEKLIAYEAVHEVQSWDDLKHRLNTDRCCYAFFHPRMPDEPLIFVQVALVNGISESIQDLLDDKAPVEDPHTVDTAVFYSITNAQHGLRGVSLGDFLIKRVANDLERQFPNLKRYATLSPVPGFRDFIERGLARDGLPSLSPSEKAEVETLLETRVVEQQQEILETSKTVKPLLMRLCAHYLVVGDRGAGPTDPVANFHLSNGARIEQVNWLGDQSDRGMNRSFGLMVNYRYRLSDIEKNHEAYKLDDTITCSSRVKSLLKLNEHP